MCRLGFQPHVEGLEARLPPGDTFAGLLVLHTFGTSASAVIESLTLADSNYFRDLDEPGPMSTVLRTDRPSLSVRNPANQPTTEMPLSTLLAEPEVRTEKTARMPGWGTATGTTTANFGAFQPVSPPSSGGIARLAYGSLPVKGLSNPVLAVPPRSMLSPASLSPASFMASRPFGSSFYFEANVGQADTAFDFLARGPGYTMGVSAMQAVFRLENPAIGTRHPESGRVNDDATRATDAALAAGPTTMLGLGLPTPSLYPPRQVSMHMVGADPDAVATGVDPLITKLNYYLGNDSNEWHAGVPTFARVHYDDVYPGIDMVYYDATENPASAANGLEYDFVVAPGADPDQIQLRFSGADSVTVDPSGELAVRVGDAELRQSAPYIYQDMAGVRQDISGQFHVEEGTASPDVVVTFAVNPYDMSRPLVIDPVLMHYSTYLGGNNTDYGYDVAVDNAGSAYVVGFTFSSNFPVVNPVQNYASEGDAFVAKFTPDGTALEYATWLGGTPSCDTLGEDMALGITVDDLENAYVVGRAGSCNFPIFNAFQPIFGDGPSDAFIVKLKPAGALSYSSYLGGQGYDFGNAVAIDGEGVAYVVGTTSSDNFPTVNPIQSTYAGGGRDFMVAKVSRDGTTLLYSTFLGGLFADGDQTDAGGIALDPFGNICVTGFTDSYNFPTYNAFQATKNGYTEAFVTKLTPDGSAFVFSTFLGGEGDFTDKGTGIATDAAGDVYVTGYTSSPDFPLVNPFQAQEDPGWTGFVTKFAADGSELIYSTYIGGNSNDLPQSLAVDSAGAAYVIGFTRSTDFPMKLPFQATNGGALDTFLAKLTPDGTGLIFSSYLGGFDDDTAQGSELDAKGNIYLTGTTLSPDFPLKKPLQATLKGPKDVFVAKLSIPARRPIVANPVMP